MKLMGAVENVAFSQSFRALNVQSSITALPFYAKWGFNIVREQFYGEERSASCRQLPDSADYAFGNDHRDQLRVVSGPKRLTPGMTRRTRQRADSV